MSENEVSAETPVGKFRVRGYDTVTVAVCVGLSAMIYILYDHTESTKNSASVAAEATKEVAKALDNTTKAATENNRETSRAIREMTCVVALDMKDRLNQIGRPDSYCKRMSQ